MKKLFSLLVLLLSFLIIFPANSSIVNTSTEEDEAYWRSLVKDKEKEISHIKTASKVFFESLDKKITEVTEFREASEFKFEQLKLKLITEVGSPYSFRSTTREVCLVIEDFSREYDKANKLLSVISNYVDIIEAFKKSIDSLLSKEIPADVKTSLKSMRSDVAYTGDRIEALQDKLKAELVVFDKDMKLLSTGLPQFKYIVMGQVIDYYLIPKMDIYHPKMWIMIGFVYKDWFRSYYHNLIQGVPDFQNEWGSLVDSFSFGIFAFLLGWFFLHKFLKKEEARRKMFTRSLFWAAFGSTVFIYSGLIDFYPRIYFNYFLIVIFFIASMMYLAWGFRCKEDAPEKKSPFEPMFWLFVYGEILQFLDIYHPVLSILWLVGIIISISYLKKQIKRNYLSFERVLLIISFILHICCFIMVIAGLVYLSIFVLLTWFVACLSIQLGINVNASSRRIVEYFAGGSHSLLKIIVLGIIAPVLWFALMVFVYWWLVGQTFGSGLLVVDLNTTIHFHGAEIHLSYVGFGVYLFFVFRAISNMTKITIRKLVSTSKVEAGAAPSISLLASYTLWCLYSVILLYLVGVNLSNLAVVTGGLSVGLGFGLRDIVNNFLSSLIILLSHSIRHGDIIEIDGIVGKVLEITIRSTIVQTNDNAIVAIPNSDIISSKLINWTSNNTAVKKDIKIGVSYDSDIEKVKYILLDIAKNTEHVLTDPPPSVSFTDFADSNLNFTLSIWADDIRIASSVTSLVREKINTEFKSNGIEMAYPQMDVHVNYPEDKAKALNI